MNRLLAALPQEDWQALQPVLDERELPIGKVLFREDQQLQEVYFPQTCIVSTVAIFAEGATVEMATIGPEGMVDVSCALGGERALSRHIIQVPGLAHVMRLAAFRQAIEERPSLRTTLFRYVGAFLAQVSLTVACNAVHSVHQRAARWLLMCEDRVTGRRPDEGAPLRLTQEFLAEMLGTTRPTINSVAQAMQKSGLIRYGRASVTITDRSGLERTSCECYRLIRDRYDRTFSRSDDGSLGVVDALSRRTSRNQGG